MPIPEWPNAKRSLDAYDLSGKRALVLGAASGTGRAIALALAEAGADLALCTVTTDGGEAMALRKTARTVRDDLDLGYAISHIRGAERPAFFAIKVRAESLPLVMPPKDGVALKDRFRAAVLGAGG